MQALLEQRSSVNKTVADTLRTYQDSILSAANAKYADDYIFGGEEVGEPPFTVNDSGTLYKNVNVDTEPSRRSTIHRYRTRLKESNTSKTAFNIAISGVELLGSGVDGNGISNNIYKSARQIANKLESAIQAIWNFTPQNSIKKRRCKAAVCQHRREKQFRFLHERQTEAEKSTQVKTNDLEILDTRRAL
jgi:hypothetical protein